jgi:hypothetical protein
MEDLKIRYDRFWIGYCLGMIGPVFGFLVFYAVTSTHMPLENFIRFIQHNGSTHSGIISISLVFNLIFFFAGSKLDMLRISQGVIGATLTYAPFVIYFKYVG